MLLQIEYFLRMNTHTISLKKGQIYIELNKVLQIIGIAQSGGHAKIMIRNEEVKVNSVVETRVRKKLIKNDLVTIDVVSVKIE